MNCNEFQNVLPGIIETGGNPEEEEHLKTCPNCSSLVADLKFIAEQAKLILPLHDPSPRVWNNIQTALQKEEQASSGRRRPHQALSKGARSKSKTDVVIAAGTAGVVLLALALLQGQSGTPNLERSQPSAGAAATPINAEEESDRQILDVIARRRPALRPVYEKSLRETNAYISDVRKTLKANPQDAFAREQLRDAYAQKAALYEMASSHSVP
jgi:hypothetical protein